MIRPHGRPSGPAAPIRRPTALAWAGVLALAAVALPTGCNDRTVRKKKPAPAIESITPAQGMAGTQITVFGTRFDKQKTNPPFPEIGGVAASIVSVVSPNELLVQVPLGLPPGPADVRLTWQDGRFAEAEDGFEVLGMPPQVLQVVPGQGPTTGGTSIAIGGADFQTGATVLVGGLPAGAVTVTGPGQITAVTPPGPDGPADVTVINPDLLAGTLPAGFAYGTAAPAPLVSTVTPDDGPSGGGTFVTVMGTNFQPGARVELGGVAMMSVGYVSSTVLTGTTAPAPPGVVDVLVRNPDGQSDTLAGGFEYTGSAIAVFAVSPRAGDMAGGDAVTVDGAGFSPGTTVTLGGMPLVAPVYVDPFTITGTTPAASAPGKVDVVGTDVTGTAILVDGFSYTVGPPRFPRIDALVPPSGAIGDTIEVQGQNFGTTPGENLVTFDGVVAPVLTASAASLTAVVPPGAATGPVAVEVAFVPSNEVDFTVTSPRVRFVSPPSASWGDPVTLIGENFSPVAADNTVRFNGMLATVILSTDTYLATTVPVFAVSGPVTLEVGGETTPGVPFCVNPPLPPTPTLIQISPSSGNAGGSVTITGTDLDPTPGNNLVRFNGVVGPVTAVGAGTLTVVVPAAAGTGSVTVEVGGIPATGSLFFTVTSPPPPAPTITNLFPDTGGEGDGVYIEGSGFDPDPRNHRVTFDGVPAEVSRAAPGWLLVTAPFASTGDVVVDIGGRTSNGSTFIVTGGGATGDTVDIFGTTLPAPSGSVVYVVDVSGTMAWTFGTYVDRFGATVSGSRLDLEKDRVIDSIDGLAASMLFNVIAFDCTTYTWAPAGMQVASAANKADAAAWVDALAPLGGTGTGPAVREALREESNRTILLVSDGLASCGGLGTAGHLCDILAANPQEATIHTFGVQTFGEYRQFLVDLAEETGGTYRDAQ